MTRRSTSSITPSVVFALLGITLILCGQAWAQSTTIRGGAGGDTAQVTNGELHVTGAFTVEGAAGGTSQADNSAVTAITGIGALYDTTPPAIADGNVGLPVMNSSRQLIVDCPNCTGGSGGTQFDEDTAHVSGDKGTLLLGVRNDSGVALFSGTNGDYTPIATDSNGRVWVNQVGSIASSVTAGTSALHLGKAEDAVHGSGDTGVFSLSIRSDSAASTAGADGDYAGFLTDASGRLWTHVGTIDGGTITSITNPVAVTGTFWQATQPVSLASVPSHAVTNAGTFAVQAAQSGTWTVQPGNTANTTPWLTSISQGGNTATVNASGQLSITCANCSGSGASAVDDAAFGVASGSGAPAMGLFDDVAPDSVNEGDAGVVRMSGNRNLYTTIRDAAGNERGLNISAGGNISVDTVTTVSAVTAISNALPAGNNNIGDVDIATLPGTGVEDAAETAGGTLHMVGTVRRDTAASSAGSNGDNATLNTDANGRLHVNNGALESGSNRIRVTQYDSSGNEIVYPTAGLTSYTAAGASTNSTNVKNAAGTVYHYSLTNTTATLYYLRMYNTSTAPTCSSATGFVESIPIPASTSGAGRERQQNIGQAFTTGISFCITGGAGSTDNTNAATGVFVSILYK